MNDTQEKITSAKLIEDQEVLKQKYEAEKEALEQENLSLQNTITKKNDEIFELQKAHKRTQDERDEWKLEARRNRRIELEKQATKETNDFLSEFNRLQQAKQMKGGRA